MAMTFLLKKRLTHHLKTLHGNDISAKEVFYAGTKCLTPIDGVGLKDTLNCIISPFDIPPCIEIQVINTHPSVHLQMTTYLAKKEKHSSRLMGF